jgi:hypothetical protein
MRVKLLLTSIVVLLVLVSSGVTTGEKMGDERKEDLEAAIAHLLEFVRTSDVVFIRNGKEHEAEDAAKHIERKYNHYKKKIKTPEDFIEKSATKSMMSGRLYQVRLKDGTVIATRDWLTAELERYRNPAKAASTDSLAEGKECEKDSL